MIYIRFPHPDLDAHGDLVAFRAKIRYADKDWQNLMPWLEAHQYIGNTGQGGGKCWYSEQPIAGKGDREVEHFRPKMSLAGLSKTHLTELRKKKIHNEILPYIEEAGSGYPWLRFEPSNYRLSSASVNMQGSKGSIFPVLKGTARLAAPVVDDVGEYAILLDPCKREDVMCLAVNRLGEMKPAFDARLDNTIDLISQWPTDAMRWLRATVSILVYDLNDTRWIKRRQHIYDQVVEDIADLKDAISKCNWEYQQKCEKNLLYRTRKDAEFASAARAAISHQIALLSSSTILAEKLTATVLQEVEKIIATAKGYS